MTLLKQSRIAAAVVVYVLILSACASKAPPNLSPEGVKYWQGNAAVVAVGDLQRIAIGLNQVQKCDAQGANCAPLLSDKNTRTVIDAVEVALKTIKVTPDGWKPASDVALTEISSKLDANGLGKLRPYLDAARTVLNQLLTF